MKNGFGINPYQPYKKDAFFLARFRFTVFCGLIAVLLLGLLFGITFSIMSQSTADKISVQLEKSLDAGTRGESQLSAGGSCMFVREVPGGVYYENFSEYHEERLSGMLEKMTERSGSFRLDGHTYVYRTDGTPQSRRGAVYDATAEIAWLSEFRRVLWAGFALGSLGVLLVAWVYSNFVIKPARDALNKQRELVANASHELKTPLTVLSANLSLLAAEPESTIKENERWLAAANSQVARMNTLVYDMLELSKMEEGTPYKIRAEVDVTSLVEGAALCVEAACFEKNVSLQVLADPSVVLFTNREGVEKLIFILLDNAVKYTPEGGEIRVSLKRKKRGAVLSVTNTGKGLTEQQRRRIFDRFYKAGNREGEGAPSFGLGLSIAKELSKQLGGDIECSSVLGESVTFTVTVNE